MLVTVVFSLLFHSALLHLGKWRDYRVLLLAWNQGRSGLEVLITFGLVFYFFGLWVGG